VQAESHHLDGSSTKLEPKSLSKQDMEFWHLFSYQLLDSGNQLALNHYQNCFQVNCFNTYFMMLTK
jgi:hypothetical protein